MLINLRNALMAGKRLPYDAEVEYLESTGTQYIDTGYAFQDNFAWEIMFNGLGYEETLFGGRNAAVRTSVLYQRVQSVGAETTIPIAGYNGVTTPFVLANLKSGLHTVKAAFATNKGLVWVDGVAIYSNQSFSGNYISGVSQAVFADNFGNGDVREFANSKVYALKMWQNGVLVRDFIPVRRGAIGYLYDRVSGKLFGNAGSGNFVLGPDVVPVEYIESHGTEWIDTGIVCQNSNVTAFEFKFAYTKYPHTRYVWGSDKGANQGINDLGHYFSGLDDSNVVIPLQTYHTGRSEVHPSSIVKAYIDGTQFRNNTGSAPYTNPFCIFALGGYTTQRVAGLRISSCKVLVDSTLIHDFISVRVGSGTTWEGAMMDVLTRRIYRNAGTGAFTYGNDLKYPIPAE